MQQNSTLHSLFYLETALHVSGGTTHHQEHKQLYLQHLACNQDGIYWSCSQAVNKPVWHIPLLCVQWKTLMMDTGTVRNVEFHFTNKFEKSMHLVGFIIRNLSWCTVTWTTYKNFYWLWFEL